MALLNKLFKSKKIELINKVEKLPAINDDRMISVNDLKKLIPIRQMDEDFLQAFVAEHRGTIFAKGERLFTVGAEAKGVYFLLQGELELTDEKGQSYIVNVASPTARFALFAGLVHTTTAIAKTKVCILKVSHKIMQMNQTYKSHSLDIPAKYESNRLLQLFMQHFRDDEIVIPAMSDTAIYLRKAMKQDIGVHEAVQIIQLDPVISGKLIQVANCPLYITQQPAKSCLDAVSRIGLVGVRNLVTSLCLKNVFNSSNPALKKYMMALWKRSIYVSSISYVLAKETKKVDPEEALLSGLIVDIGIIPLLNFVGNLPADFYTEKELKEAVGFVRGIVGKCVLEKWDFPEQLVDIPLYASDWYHPTGAELTLLDIVILAQLHSKIGQNNQITYPAISSIPAASKLEDASLSPEYSLAILHNAKDKINNALSAFSQY